MSEWKYVKRDGLPKEGRYMVAVVGSWQSVEISEYWGQDGGTWEHYNDGRCDEVYAWRELPEPPPYEPDEQS